MTEEWRPVLGFEGSYEVSSLGRVRSLDRTIVKPSSAGIVTNFRWRGRLLRLSPHPCGYVQVSLGMNKPRLVHALMCESWYGARPPGMEACHDNDVKDDNRIENLRWDTSSQNKRDAVRNKRRSNYIYLSEDEIASIINLYEQGTSISEIAAEFRIPRKRISHMVKPQYYIDKAQQTIGVVK